MTTSADTKDAGHTPGPWEYWSTDRTIRSDQHDVAHMPEWLPEFNREREANARLIASAPELLEALKGIRELISLADLSDPEQCAAALNDIDAIAAHQIRAAISRAEGR